MKNYMKILYSKPVYTASSDQPDWGDETASVSDEFGVLPCVPDEALGPSGIRMEDGHWLGIHSVVASPCARLASGVSLTHTAWKE